MAARLIRAGEAQVVVAGGVESMSRAPFVMPKADAPFSRSAEIHDTTIGWRFVNPRLRERYGIDSMPETGENVAAQFNIARADQEDRKSTRLNSSHGYISYAVFCLKKKKT